MNRNIGVYYFSGIGNTRLVTNALTGKLEHLGYKCRTVGLKAETEYRKSPGKEVLGIAFPVYGLNIPSIVRRFLNSLPGETGGECFIIANSHTNPGLSIKQSMRILEKKGYTVLGVLNTNTPSSSVITEDTEPETTAGIMKNAAREKAEEFAEQLHKGCRRTESNMISFKELLVSVLFRIAMPKAVIKTVAVKDSCTECGRCAQDCPMGNISIVDNKPVWGSRCEVCMRCINFCPAEAIDMLKSEGKTRYRGGAA